MALSRVSTTTGLFLSGAANAYSRISPRAIPPAKLPPLPNHLIRCSPEPASNSLGGLVPPLRKPLISADALAARPAPGPIDSVWSAAQPDRWPLEAPYREQSEPFAYVSPYPHHTPHSIPQLRTYIRPDGLNPKAGSIARESHPRQSPVLQTSQVLDSLPTKRVSGTTNRPGDYNHKGVSVPNSRDF
jgi:hypothetical protein